MTRLGLTLNEAKTSVRDGRKESFDWHCHVNSVASARPVL